MSRVPTQSRRSAKWPIWSGTVYDFQFQNWCLNGKFGFEKFGRGKGQDGKLKDVPQGGIHTVWNPCPV